MKKRRRYNILQRLGIALIMGGAGLVILSIDPYATGSLSEIGLLVRAIQGGMLIAAGWLLWRPWMYPDKREKRRTRREEEKCW